MHCRSEHGNVKPRSASFLESIYNDDLSEVQRLVQRCGIDPNSEFNDRIPLYIACEAQSTRVVDFLVKQCHVSVNSKNFFEETPLHVAVRHGNLELVKILVERGARVNRGDGDRIRPIHIAASMGDVSIFQYLLENGAQLNVLDRNGNSPLHCALINDHIELAQILFQNGANVNLQDRFGNTPLMIAAVRGLNLRLIDSLLIHGADPNILNKKGRSPLFASIYHNHSSKVSVRLLESGSNFGLTDTYNDNYTLLHYACVHGREELVRKLVELGIDLDSASTSNETPLFVAVKRCFTGIAKYLISRGCNVNTVTSNAYDHSTPLHAAIRFYRRLDDFTDLVDSLVEAGLKLNYRQEPQIVSKGVPSKEPCEVCSPVMLALLCQQYKFAAYLISIGCELDTHVFVSGSVLHKAFMDRRLELMLQMYEVGIDLSKETWIYQYVHREDLAGFDHLKCLLTRFLELVSYPRRLSAICRIAIRKYLLEVRNCRSIKVEVRKLQLPPVLRSFVMVEFCAHSHLY